MLVRRQTDKGRFFRNRPNSKTNSNRNQVNLIQRLPFCLLDFAVVARTHMLVNEVSESAQTSVGHAPGKKRLGFRLEFLT